LSFEIFLELLRGAGQHVRHQRSSVVRKIGHSVSKCHELAWSFWPLPGGSC
jgi:hypothetical protein